ncbi:Hypothetical protein KVN_LOCUS264 [uncultured virus]|nr:Hypothetical protein KVN_LOCUS264 [uncultured virus]
MHPKSKKTVNELINKKYNNESCKDNNQSKEVFIPNEFLTSLLNPNEKNNIIEINNNLTKKILNCICPSIQSISNLQSSLDLQQYNQNLSIKIDNDQSLNCINNNNDKQQNQLYDPFSDTNQILFGTPICRSLTELYLFGLTKEEIICLNSKYNTDRLGNNKRLEYFPLIIVYREMQYSVFL